MSLLLASVVTAQVPSSPPPPPDGFITGVDINLSGHVNLHVDEMPLPTVLRLMSMKGKRNIVASPQVKGIVTANLYNVPFEEALQAVLAAHDAGYRVVGNFIYVYTSDEIAKLAATETQPVTRVFSLNWISSTDAEGFIKPMLGPGGTASISTAPEAGLTTDVSKVAGNSNALPEFIVITALPANLREIERVLKAVDVRPKQVLVEATILRATLSDKNDLGIDFTIVGGADLELLGTTSNGISNVVLGDLPQSRLEFDNYAAQTGFTNDVPRGGLQFGIVKDHVAVFLRALEQVTDTTVLANPKVLALNRQKGFVIVGRRDGYLTTTVTETQAIQSVEFLETGTQLTFRPFVADDGFIRVELHPEDSVGFVNAQGLPSKQTTEVTTNIVIRDGDTILIGGLFREVTTAAKKQVPLLGNIPGVGSLFRSKNDSTEREEVIILLTLHVVKDHARYADASRGELEAVEKTRVGARRGLMWFGRERLAQSHCRRAVAALESGKVDRAEWHATLAHHLDSRLVPAQRMREELNQKRFWESQWASGGRAFLFDLVAHERGKPADPMFKPPTEGDRP